MIKLCLLLALCLPAYAANPPGLQFEIALPEGRSTWRQGERIPLILRLSSSTPDRWLADVRMGDRVGRLNDAEAFRVEPTAGVRDPLEGLPGQSGGFGGISGGPAALKSEPFEYGRDLNEWIEFLQPGTYSLTVTTRRVSGIKETAAARQFPRGNGRVVELVSNTLNLQIVEAEPSWASEQVREAVQLLGRSEPSEEAELAVRDGGRILRFLGTREAAFAMVRHLGGGAGSPRYDFRYGILSNPHRAEVLPFMEQRLTAPDQAVDDLFVETLAHLAALIREGLPASAPADEAERERWTLQNRERGERWATRRADYYGDLAAALNGKTAAARAICAAALSAYSSSQPSPPAWKSSVAASLRERFRELPRIEQRDLLSHRWHEIAGPEMIPILQDLYEQQEDPAYRETANWAVRRLYGLDRIAGRQLIVEQILQPTHGLELDTALMLDDKTLPEAFELFAVHLRAGSHSVDHLVLRYGDSRLVDLAVEALHIRRKAFGDANQAACVSALHLFVLREDPERGVPEFLQDFAYSAVEKPQCLNLQQNKVVGRHAWSPALEKILGNLPADSPPIARESATELLGQYGSPDTEDVLWAALEAFRREWQSRSADLESDPPSGDLQLERALRTALAKGAAWDLDRQGLTRLRSLCVSDWCRSDVDSWTTESAEPVPVGLSSSDSEDFSANIGRYHLRSHEDMLAKISQFRAGARFRWNPRPDLAVRPWLTDTATEMERLLPGLLGASGR